MRVLETAIMSSTSSPVAIECTVFLRVRSWNCPAKVLHTLLPSQEEKEQGRPTLLKHSLLVSPEQTVDVLLKKLRMLSKLSPASSLLLYFGFDKTFRFEDENEYSFIRIKSHEKKTIGSLPGAKQGVVIIRAYETTLYPRLLENKTLKSVRACYGDIQECIAYDTDPTEIVKGISWRLFPDEPEWECKNVILGQRFDAKDQHGKFHAGTVIKHLESDNGLDKFRVHFDDFDPRWDETYEMEDFKRGNIRPLYSTAQQRTTPVELKVCHLWHDDDTNTDKYFGCPIVLQFHPDWTLARGAAHIFTQATRFLQVFPQVTSDISSAVVNRAHWFASQALAKTIHMMVQADREHAEAVLSCPVYGYKGKDPRAEAKLSGEQIGRRLGRLKGQLPFEILVTIEKKGNLEVNQQPDQSEGPGKTIPYPYSVERTFGNMMSARNVIVLRWRSYNNLSQSDNLPPTMYVPEPFQRVLSNSPQTAEPAVDSEAPPTPPDYLLCPITSELMKDPVITTTGISYERAAIVQWLKSGRSTCPVTRGQIRVSDLFPNRALKEAVENWSCSTLLVSSK